MCYGVEKSICSAKGTNGTKRFKDTVKLIHVDLVSNRPRMVVVEGDSDKRLE